MQIEVKKLSQALENDFFQLHSQAPFGQCFCIAWEVPTWDNWNSRTSEKNRMFRKMLFDKRHVEGYLFYLEGQPVGWCQCGPRDRWVKLTKQYGLSPDKEMYAITCFVLLPRYRKLGLTHLFVEAVLKDLKSQEIRRIQAFPRRGEQSDEEVWTGPESVFVKTGFALERDDPAWPVYQMELTLKK